MVIVVVLRNVSNFIPCIIEHNVLEQTTTECSSCLMSSACIGNSNLGAGCCLGHQMAIQIHIPSPHLSVLQSIEANNSPTPLPIVDHAQSSYQGLITLQVIIPQCIQRRRR